MTRVVDVFGGVERVLFLGAHCDDIEIGCGATLRRIVRLHPSTEVRLVIVDRRLHP